jgi:hypothetical protein
MRFLFNPENKFSYKVITKFHCGLSATREQLLQQWARRDKPVCWHPRPDGFELEIKGRQPIPIK